MSHFVCITRPKISWADYVECAQLALGFNPVQDQLDKKQTAIDSIAGFARSLEAIINPDKVARHIHYGFLIVADMETFFRLMQHQPTLDISLSETVNPDYYMGIVSSHLQGWKTSLLALCDGDEPQTVRRLANNMLQFFEHEEGLYRFFLDVTKKKMSDGTLRLTVQ